MTERAILADGEMAWYLLSQYHTILINSPSSRARRKDGMNDGRADGRLSKMDSSIRWIRNGLASVHEVFIRTSRRIDA